MATSSQNEAIKLIAEWSKWLVAVQTAAIGFVATLLRPDAKTCVGPSLAAKIAFITGLVSFILAIVAAGALQSSLPTTIIDIGPNESIWSRSIYFLNKSFGKLWAAVELQFGLFLLGVASFAVSVIVLMG